ncbi:aldolase [Metabacillus litoralis]|uniref:HPr kinase/phosphorylase n=1 Tax=Metabacillus TaxID=2675233 RepID=UPI001E2B1C6A|nr:aldolase [Metabacillus litoralis]UHA57908.1 aldolase [Metabacillus litoralis]
MRILETTKYNMYKAFGLTIKSEIILQELIQRRYSEAADIEIKINTSLKNCFKSRPFEFLVENQTVTFMVPEIAIFQVKDGKEITVSPFEGANQDIIRLYLLGSSFGALLLQRGIYPLHGSAIAIDGKAFAIIGDSGAGKSTLASAFMERGYQLLSDDVIAVKFSKENLPIVIPSYPQQKLWQQSLDAFGISNEKLRPIYGRESKFCKPVIKNFHTTQLPLGGIFELVKTNGDSISIHPIHGLDLLQKLFTHTYRQFLIPKLNLTKWHFIKSTLLAERLPFYQIKRPETGFSAFQIVEKILTEINSSGNNTNTQNEIIVNR